jgi:hypothetical protein
MRSYPPGFNGREMEAFDDEYLRAEQRAVDGGPLASAMCTFTTGPRAARNIMCSLTNTQKPP